MQAGTQKKTQARKMPIEGLTVYFLRTVFTGGPESTVTKTAREWLRLVAARDEALRQASPAERAAHAGYHGAVGPEHAGRTVTGAEAMQACIQTVVAQHDTVEHFQIHSADESGPGGIASAESQGETPRSNERTREIQDEPMADVSPPEEPHENGTEFSWQTHEDLNAHSLGSTSSGAASSARSSTLMQHQHMDHELTSKSRADTQAVHKHASEEAQRLRVTQVYGLEAPDSSCWHQEPQSDEASSESHMQDYSPPGRSGPFAGPVDAVFGGSPPRPQLRRPATPQKPEGRKWIPASCERYAAMRRGPAGGVVR